MKPSGSKLQLLDNCTYWARDDVEKPEEESSEPAEYGTYTHKLTELMIEAGSPIITTAPPATLTKERAEQAYVDAVDMYEWQRDAFSDEYTRETEVSYAYNLKTHRVTKLPKMGRDSYSAAGPDEICATLDLVISKPGYVACADFKTGTAPNWKYEKQLRFGALLLSRLKNAKEVECYIVRPGAQPSRWIETEDAVDDYAVFLATRLAQAPGSEPTPGSHCHELYCPIRATCPATQALVKQLPDGLSLPVTGAITGPDHAAYTLARVAVARDALDAIEAKVRDYATEHDGIRLPDGRVYKQVERTTRSIVLTEGADQVLLDNLGPEYYNIVEKKITQTAIERLAGSKSKKTKIMRELEQVSAIKNHSHLRFDYVKGE